MARVTVEGTLTPSTFLARGARVTVERTRYINKLIARGYIKVVAELPDREAPAQAAENAPAPSEDTDATAPARAPGTSATKAEWQAFLREEGFDVPDDWTKAQLIEVWRGIDVDETDDANG